MPTPRKPRPSGGAARLAAGLVLISLQVTPEERDAIRTASALARERSMASFARTHVVAAALDVLQAHGLGPTGEKPK